MPAFRALASLLLSDDRNGEINSLVHHLRLDAVDLHAMLEEIGIEGGKIPDDTRLELDLLQAIRLALIMRVFILAAQMPRFSPRNDVSHRQLFETGADARRAGGRRRDAAGVPAARQGSRRPRALCARRRPTARTASTTTARVETEILAPMEEAYEFIREIGTGISHHFGAFG